MPKIYSETERTDIKDSLKREANILMIERGIKKTTVDELVKRAGIPKGTFYLFYPSKEMLLFECIQDFHNEADKIISAGMEQIIRKYKSRTKGKRFSNECLDEITDVLMEAINITRGSCLKIMLDPESMNLLISKLPEDVLKKHGSDSKENILLEFFGKIRNRKFTCKKFSVFVYSDTFRINIFAGLRRWAGRKEYTAPGKRSCKSDGWSILRKRIDNIIPNKTI